MKVYAERKYKDTLWQMIFGNEARKEWTLSLYNALHNTDYTDPDAITINTLENGLYITAYNDVSFLIFGEINLLEHASSWSLNNAYRILEYLMEQWGKEITDESLNVYSSRTMKLNEPCAFVIYNGSSDNNIPSVIRLSDLYKTHKYDQLEMTIPVYNMNAESGKQLMERCRPLKEYQWLVERITNNTKDFGSSREKRKQAVDEALYAMPMDFEIRDTLMKEKEKVENMMLSEMTQEGYERMVERAHKKEVKEARAEAAAKATAKATVRATAETETRIAARMLHAGFREEQISALTGIAPDRVRKAASERRS